MDEQHETTGEGSARHAQPAREDERKARSRAAFDAQAAIYDEGMPGEHARRLYPHVLRAACAAVAGVAGPRVLDVGCGTGALAELVLEAIPGCRLTGIDLAPVMVARAQARLAGRATVQEGDAEHLPFRDHAFDLVVCCDSFHHYPDPARAAFNLWRVLDRGGTLVLADTWQPAPARALMNAWMPYSREGDVRIYAEDELRALLAPWFTSVHWERVGLTACLVVARP